MKPELKEKIIAYNKKAKEKSTKADDFDILIGALLKMPYGQLKKVLSNEAVIEVMKKYGYEA